MDKCIIPILLQLNKLDIVQKQLYTHQFWCIFLPQSSPFLVKQTKFWYILGSPNTPIGNQVKHTLILLSIILLSSPVIGQETGVLYLYESSSGFVLKSFGDGKVQPKYKGEISNGKPNGFGVLTYPYGEKSVVGVWKNGKEWYTKLTKKDGTLIGKFEDGE